ncbi:iron ABC transporter permease [Shouchella lehensis]|nr:iron ABC transporter permease [Shouchella lehensis]
MKYKKNKSALSFLLGSLILIGLSVMHLVQGQADLSIGDLFSSWDQRTEAIMGVRFPRLMVGILAGGCLAMAGLVLQTMTKNPLASAGTLGINAGAYLFVVIGTLFFPGVNASFLFSFLGACFAAFLVFMLAGKTMSPVRIVLTGMIITLLFGALTSSLQLMYEQESNGLFLWGAGTLMQNDWSGVAFIWPFALFLGLLAILSGKKFDLIHLGDEAAKGLGLPLRFVKTWGWALGILLASATVSVVGPIGFIGLMAPHLVRLMGIRGHRLQFVHTFMWGAVILIAADVLSRLISPNSELPVGAMTAFIGSPWLMYLAYKAARKMRSDKQKLTSSKKTLNPIVVTISLIGVSLVVAYVSISFGGGQFTSIQEMFAGKLVDQVTIQFRWPRVLVSFLVGALLALCGALLQNVLKNPLGDPSIIGITSGGGAGALLILVVFPSLPYIFLPIGAVIGSIMAVLIVILATKRSGFEPISLALMGVAVSAMASGVIQILTVKASLSVSPALVWLAGSTYRSTWDNVVWLLVMLVILVPFTLSLSKHLNVLAFSNEVSISLGSKVKLLRITSIVIAVLIGAVCVSIVGAIGFIGLLAPHAARALVGSAFQRVIPVSMMIGGTLLIIADFLSRYILYPTEIPSGLLVALVGAPYILYVMRKL